MTQTNPALAAFVARVRVHRAGALGFAEMQSALKIAIAWRQLDDQSRATLEKVRDLVRDLDNMLPHLEAEAAKGTKE